MASHDKVLPIAKQIRRLFLLLAGGFVLLWAVGYGFARWIQPKEAVWLDMPPVWPDMPLAVELSGLQDQRDSVYAAMELWNGQIGCQLFVLGGPADITITLGQPAYPCGGDVAVPIDRDQAGATYLCPSGQVTVWLIQPGDLYQSYIVVAHELGHALGLAHDRDRPSIMVPDAARYTIEDLAIVTDKDIAALRGRYCDREQR